MLLTALSLAMLGQPMEMRLVRNPDIYGDQVVFQYAADLWTMNRNEGIARRLTSHVGSEGAPRFSPDGKWIAFTGSYDGNPDVYVIPSEGGEPVRLTFTGDPEVVVDWTPDGRVAYKTTAQSQYFTMPGLWIVSPKGGMPTRTKISEISDGAFSPDGSTVAYNRTNSHGFNWRRYRGGTQGRIGFFDLGKNSYSEIPSGRENRWQPYWGANNKVYYIGDKDFGTRNLFEYDVASKRERRLTDYRDADIKNPSSDGKTIVFERDGVLYGYDIASSKVTAYPARAVSDFPNSRPRLRNVADSISGMAISPSGVRVAVEARGDIFTIPNGSGETRNLTNTQGVRETNPAWSPDGQTVAYLSDVGGNQGLYIVPQKGGAAKKIPTNPKHFIRSIDWMPDSKSIIFITNDSGLYLVDVASGKETQITKNEWQSNPSYDVSSDGSWIAYTGTNDNLQNSLYLYNVADKKSTRITDGYFSDDSVSFDMTGKYLYFTSSRTFLPDFGAFEIALSFAPPQRVYMITLSADQQNPLVDTDETDEPEAKADAPKATEPPPASAAPAAAPPSKPSMKIDLEGISERIIPLPWPPGQYFGVLGTNNGVLTFDGSGITLFSVAAKQSIPIYQGPIGGLAITAKRNKMAINVGNGIIVQDIRPGANPSRVSTSNVEMMWDPRAEWKQILRESWRWQRDVFYDPGMLGLNWDAIWTQYEKYLPYVNHRADLNYVIGMMIGELGTGHAYVQGGEMGDMGRPTPIGSLGADYRVDGKNVRFGKIFRGLSFDESRRGPLGDPGLNIKEGDYLLAIDGNTVTSDVDPNKFLVNKVNKLVTLTVNSSSSMNGARKVKVRPVGSEQQLRYISWVEANRKYVSDMTGGKVGYIHVPDTSFNGMIEFAKGFYSQTDKEAWIIDERFNGGGFIPTFFTEFLRRQVEAKMKTRDYKDIWFPTGALEGPKVMLVNEYAGSGGDMLPWLFKKDKLGKLIGKRTWGGLVGIQGGVPLVDGGQVTAPGFGIFDPFKGEWIAENTGVDPDIDVDARPDLIAAGKDPQLDAALKEIQDAMKRTPRRTQKTPAFPRPKPGQ